MSELQKDQIGQWLKKLEQESWQLELLVSAFTIFLLIQAIEAFSGFYEGIPYQYFIEGNILSFLYVFLGLVGLSIKVLSIFLIIHLLLRGFWIGTIGLRSVQSRIDFPTLRYGSFFDEKLKKKVASLDDMVVLLDEICSVIFSFSFLVMSVLIAFGMYTLLLGFVSICFNYVANFLTGTWLTILSWLSIVTLVAVFLTGLIYMIDYFTLGFFKKFDRLGKLYYPIYRFYSIITISVVSRSIYYYLISKFSKKRIRIVFLAFGTLVFFNSITEYDQHQYFSAANDEFIVKNECYDNLRPEGKYISRVSIPSNVVSGSFLQLFLRYDARDNDLIQKQCPDFEPLKEEGLNLLIDLYLDNGRVTIGNQDYKEEDSGKLLGCLTGIYKVYVNNSLYAESPFYFFVHPDMQQKGLTAMLPTEKFRKGQNELRIKKVVLNEEGSETMEDYAIVPFWFE